MANALGELFSDIANAIREKTGNPGMMKPIEFPEQIATIDMGADTFDATATEYDLASGATAYVGGEKITGALPVHHVAQAEAEEVYDSGGSVKMSLTNMERAIYDSGAVITVSAPLEEFGDATAEDVAVGKTFTSADGMLVVGTGSGSGGGGSSDELCYVTFMSHDGTEEYGKKAVAVGDDCANPIERGIFDTPSIGPTDQYIRLFDGWSTTINGETDEDALKAVWEDRTVYATYVNNVRSYFIRFYDGDTLIHSVSYNYGEMPSYTPTKDGYDFVAWEPELTTVTGEASYTAIWKAKAAFATASWAEIAEVCAAGDAASTFALGDTKEITMTDGYNLILEIVGINFDDLADGSGKAPLTIWARRGTASTSWSITNQRWLDETQLKSKVMAYKDKLPSDLQALIKTVKKKTMIGTAQNNYTATQSNEDLFLFSRGEMFPSSNIITDGPRYPHFTTAANRIAYTLSGTAVQYTLRSSAGAWNGYWDYISDKGESVSGTSGSSKSGRIPFAFCI